VDAKDRRVWNRYQHQLADTIVGQAELQRVERARLARLRREKELRDAQRALYLAQRRAARAVRKANHASTMSRRTAAFVDPVVLKSTSGLALGAATNVSKEIRRHESFETQAARIVKMVDQSFAAAPDATSAVVQKYKKHVIDDAMWHLKRKEARRRAAEKDDIWRRRRRIQRIINHAFRSLSVRKGRLEAFERYRRLTFLNALRHLEKLTSRVYLLPLEREELKQLLEEATAAWNKEEQRQKRAAAEWQQKSQNRQRRYEVVRNQNKRQAQEQWGKRQAAKDNQQSMWAAYISGMQTLRVTRVLSTNSSVPQPTAAPSASIKAHLRHVFRKMDIAAKDAPVMRKYEERLAQHATATAAASASL